MGIHGLLPLLKSIHRPCHLKKFAGRTVGIDAYGWLHRGAIACAVDIGLGRPTTKFLDFAMHRVRMLQHFGIVPYLVFDGDFLPGKAGTEADRARRREECRRAGLELLKLGKVAQAHAELQKAIDITPEMAGQLIEDLKRAGIAYLVAPYEADAQLAYLERKGVISAIMSEDSDLLVFGAKCLLTKLDQYGNCIEINRADFTACRDISLMGWSDAEFRRMAILSGCDYLPGVNKMGLKTAYRLVRQHKNIDRVIRAMQLEGHLVVPDGYLAAFREAELTFLHQRVFCPLLKEVVLCTEPELGMDEDQLLSIGARVDPDVAEGVARGDLHPTTKEPLKVVARAKDNVPSHAKPTRSRLPRVTATEDEQLKRGMSIDAFFKSRRTPLAELDPNSFMPSASQRRLLDQHSSTSWPVRSAPARSDVETSTDVGGMPVAASRRPLGPLQEAGNHPTLGAESAARATKRPRLCGADDAGSKVTLPETHQEEKSRFFALPEARSSSTRSQARRSIRADFSIYSEASVEEGSCSKQERRHTSRKSAAAFQVFQDGDDGKAATGTSSFLESKIYQCERMRAGELSKRQPDILTSARPDASTGGRSPRVSTEQKAAQAAIKSEADGHLAGVISKDDAVVDASPTSTTLPKATILRSIVRPSTPLERIGFSALSREKASRGGGQFLSQTNASTMAGKAQAEAAQGAIQTEGSDDVRGSEDLMIPDSEGEE